MKAAKPPAPKTPDFAAVLDAKGFTEAYKAAVLAVLPNGVEATDAFWLDLETAIDRYISFRSRRPRQSPIRERDRWQHLDRLVDELAAELRTVRKETPWSHNDPLWPVRALTALYDMKRHTEAHAMGYAMLVEASRGRGDRALAYLTDAVLDLWRDHVGRLTYSVSRGRKRGGPVIRFFLAAISPLVDPPPSASTIAAMIDERRRQDKRRRR